MLNIRYTRIDQNIFAIIKQPYIWEINEQDEDATNTCAEWKQRKIRKS